MEAKELKYVLEILENHRTEVDVLRKKCGTYISRTETSETKQKKGWILKAVKILKEFSNHNPKIEMFTELELIRNNYLQEKLQKQKNDNGTIRESEYWIARK